MPVDHRKWDAMRAVVQRVDGASVTVGGEVIGGFSGLGLCVLVGVTHSDDQASADKLADKIWGLRIFDGAPSADELTTGRGSERSASELNVPLLVVSQFTLYADTRKGRRPSWNQASPAAHSEPLVEAFVQALRARGAQVSTGRFGADMSLALTNVGPVTLIVEAGNS